MSVSLTELQSKKIEEKIVAHLGSAVLRLPQDGESEPAFSKSVLAPAISAATVSLRQFGAVISGPGLSPVLTVRTANMEFIPDVAILFHRERLVAVEAKFIGTSGRQQALTQSIGQSVVYRALGYRHAVVVVADTSRAVTLISAAEIADVIACSGSSAVVIYGTKSDPRVHCRLS